MHKISFVFNAAWVLSHQRDSELPVDAVSRALRERFPGFSEITKNFQEYVVSASEQDAEKIRGAVEEFFRSSYPNDVFGEVVTVTTEALAAPKKDDGEDSELSPMLRRIKELMSDMDKEAEEAPEQNAEVTLDSLVGCDEFKALMREIELVAPQIIRNNTYDTFSYQNYIFAINDGYGLSTCLKIFADVLNKTHLLEVKDNIFEEKLSPPHGDSLDPFRDAISCVSGRSSQPRIVCVDISEWMSNLNSREFRYFLHEVSKYQDNRVVIFRVPFVDVEALGNVRGYISDVLYVRTVSFPPLSMEEINQCAEREFKKRGFSIASDAWADFDDIIYEEKSDGRFYGVNTVAKVVREVLYKKQLSNAENNVDDKVVTASDARAVCAKRHREGELTGYQLLDSLVGAEPIKQRITEIVSMIELARKDASIKSPCIHMRFVGNPGTGKTTVARILGQILKEKGVLRIGSFFEYAGRDFCGRYIGETAPKTSGICRDAYGSVLFIDEAYSLYRGGNDTRDFGVEALTTLIAEMENHRSDLLVIMAGYTDDMETLMRGNAGLASRMPYVVEFPNFTRPQLYEIFMSMMKDKFRYEEDLPAEVEKYFLGLSDGFINSKEFSNARFVRNLFERTWAKAATRCGMSKTDVVLTAEDFRSSVADKEFSANLKKRSGIGFLAN